MPRRPSNPKPRKRTRSEKSIQSSILRWLVSTGLLHWRQSAGLLKVGRKKIRLGPSGIPDILVVVGENGHLLGLEVKSATGKQRPTQVEFQKKMEAAGATYRIVRSVADAKMAVTESYDR